MWQFLKSRIFLYNIHGIIAAYFIVFWLTTSLLNSYTRHGETITVPDIRGLSIEKAKQILSERNLDFAVADSSFSDKKPKLAVLDQSPMPNEKVKEGRTIYLTLNSVIPPQVKMPDLTDNSLKQAQMVLENVGLRVGQLIYKPDLAQNVVLDWMNKGKKIPVGQNIKKGSTIDLILGDGLGNTEVDVPELIGHSLREVRFILDASSLNLGAVIADNTVRGDSLDAVVYKQMPSPDDVDNKLNLGEAVDVYITKDQSKVISGGNDDQ